ncbi:MAG: helix-turn-helix domain-containing protein [Gammaproteobacteria bacterium]|nr:helix-turn-helix domain-containing protein [Gammaproteobacteria bacterium]
MCRSGVVVEQIAEHLGVTRDSIYRWIDSKGLPAHRIGRLWKFKISAVDDWVQAAGADDRKSQAGDDWQFLSFSEICCQAIRADCIPDCRVLQ